MGGKKGGFGGLTKGIFSTATSMLGGKDFLFGKKDPGVADSFSALDPIQKKALDQYGGLLDKTKDMAGAQGAAMENQIRQNAADAERQAKQLTAQRGLGNSSVGLNAIINSTRDMGDKIGAVRAQLPSMQLSQLNNASSGINNILNSRIFKQGREGGQRTGGMSQIIGAGIGGYMGGPGGAQAGMGIGKAMGNVS